MVWWLVVVSASGHGWLPDAPKSHVPAASKIQLTRCCEKCDEHAPICAHCDWCFFIVLSIVRLCNKNTICTTYCVRKTVDKHFDLFCLCHQRHGGSRLVSCKPTIAPWQRPTPSRTPNSTLTSKPILDPNPTPNSSPNSRPNPTL